MKKSENLAGEFCLALALAGTGSLIVIGLFLAFA